MNTAWKHTERFRLNFNRGNLINNFIILSTYFRPQGEVAPSQEVEFHSRPASILVNLPITNTIHEQESKAEETINVDQLDDLLQTLETIQEDILTQNNKVANIELLKELTILT